MNKIFQEMADALKDPEFMKLPKEERTRIIRSMESAAAEENKVDSPLKGALSGAASVINYPSNLGKKAARALGADEGSIGEAAGGLGGDLVTGLALEAIPGAQPLGTGKLALTAKSAVNLAKAIGTAGLQNWAKHAETGDVGVSTGDLIAGGTGGGLQLAGTGIRALSGLGLQKGLNLTDDALKRVQTSGGKKFVTETADAARSSVGRLSGKIGGDLTDSVVAARASAGEAFRKSLAGQSASGRGVEGVLRSGLKKLGVAIDDVAIDPATGRATVALSRKPGLKGKAVLSDEDLNAIKTGVTGLYESMAKNWDPAAGWKGVRISAEDVSSLRDIFGKVSPHSAVRNNLMRMLPKASQEAKATQASVEKAAKVAGSYGAEPPVDALVDRSAVDLAAKAESKARQLINPFRSQVAKKEISELSETLGAKSLPEDLQKLADALQIAGVFGRLKLGSISQIATDIANKMLLSGALPVEGFRKFIPVVSRILAINTPEATGQEK